MIFALIRNYRRRKFLTEKYGKVIADEMMKRAVWQGMTAEQLFDSLGEPNDKDTQRLKSKSRETWKYGRIGKNRYKERYHLEDDVVIGWTDTN